MIIAFIIIGTLLIIGIGAYCSLKYYRNSAKENDFIIEYLNNFRTFVNTYSESGEKKIDVNLYEWLTKNAGKAQGIVGWCGIMDYKPAYANYHVPQYQIIINTIPKFRDRSIQDFDVRSVDDSLIRYLGESEESIKAQETKLWNPLIWFRVGMQQLLSIPLMVLDWLGILSTSKTHKIKRSKGYSIFAGLFSLITIIGSIMTIIMGWDHFLDFTLRILDIK